MICYKDMTFCSSNCVNAACRRMFGDAEREGARKWGDTFGHENDPPVAFSDFAATCDHYQRPKE